MCHCFMYQQKGNTHTLFIKLRDTTDCKKHPHYGDVKTKSGDQKNVYIWNMLLGATWAGLLSIRQTLVLALPFAFLSDLPVPSLLLNHPNLCSSWSSHQPISTLYQVVFPSLFHTTTYFFSSPVHIQTWKACKAEGVCVYKHSFSNGHPLFFSFWRTCI